MQCLKNIFIDDFDNEEEYYKKLKEIIKNN